MRASSTHYARSDLKRPQSSQRVEYPRFPLDFNQGAQVILYIIPIEVVLVE